MTFEKQSKISFNKKDIKTITLKPADSTTFNLC